jgi:hypothetical protein
VLQKLREAASWQYGPFRASKCRCSVNQKRGEIFEVEIMWVRRPVAVRGDSPERRTGGPQMSQDDTKTRFFRPEYSCGRTCRLSLAFALNLTQNNAALP